ncbi:MAG: 1-acyl-sn-glycerol-3-phosphate acyltransferase [Clostridiales bacterium]|jgi:1-acyl-sn-glycerol-3-phosphate acyltransferase|nr:1-acyl-sn-glycerol-3-phosphate acyltransferase [Clostridiales bacterium]
MFTLCRYIAAFFLLLRVGRVRVSGLENIPKGGAVACGNHGSFLDPVLLDVAARRRFMFMAKKELFKSPILGGFLKWLGSYPINRGAAADTAAFKTTLDLLNKNRLICIFIQGRRDRSGSITKPKPGAALFAAKSGAPVLPFAIITDYKPGGGARVIFGKPFGLDGETASPRENSELIAQRINELLAE